MLSPSTSGSFAKFYREHTRKETANEYNITESNVSAWAKIFGCSKIFKQSYEMYLRSDRWRELALQVKRNSHWTCFYCGVQTPWLDVHHITYDRVFHETIEDLRPTCRDCHCKIHGR